MSKSNKALFLTGNSTIGIELARLAEQDGLTPVILGHQASDTAESLKVKGKAPISIEMKGPEYDPTVGKRMIEAGPYELVFWTTSIVREVDTNIARFNQANLMSPYILITTQLKSQPAKPVQLVVISANMPSKMRERPEVYTQLRNTKLALTRDLGRTLPNDSPDSRVLLVNTDEMVSSRDKAPLAAGEKPVMRTKAVAAAIYQVMSGQESDFQEVAIQSSPRGRPCVEF